MNVWRWFCQLGTRNHRQVKPTFGNIRYRAKAAYSNQSGLEEICTRLQGETGCQCGSTMRGMHCIWSYYRIS